MTSSHPAAERPPRSEAEPVSDPLGAGAVAAAARRGGRWLRWQQRLVQLVKFGAVGAIAFVVDVGLMNLLRFGPGELLGDKPLTAKAVSVAAATMVAWLGNRYWAFAENRREQRGRELVWFLLVNAGGMLIALGALGVSHYVLGLTSPLADNIAANGVGLALGTAFRYFCYRYLVFTGRPTV